MSHECRCGDVDLQGSSARSSAYPMIEVREALQKVITAATVLADAPSGQQHAFLPLVEAVGHVIAQDRHATEPLPAFAAATMDGYAVISADGAGVWPVVSQATAGGVTDPDFVLQRGQIAYIATGAPVPAGADAVLPVEWTESVDAPAAGADPAAPTRVRVTQAISAGANIRPVGCDISVGQTVLRAGQLIGPAEAGLAASLGLAQLHVLSQPVVGVMSSGDEVQDAATAAAGRSSVHTELTPALSQVWDSNRPLLLSLVRSAGAKAVDLGIVRDDEAVLKQRVLAALKTVDILVLTGGVSMGARDYVKPLLASLGTVHFGRVNMKPGKPLTFAEVVLPGTEQRKLVFGLPGNPVSALVTAQLFVLPAIKILLQGPSAVPQGTHGYLPARAKVTGALKRDATRPEYHRVHLRYDAEHDEWHATSTGNQQSSRLLSGCGANGLVRVEAGQGEVAAGEEVKAMLVGAWNAPAAHREAPPLPMRPASLSAHYHASPPAAASGASSAPASASSPPFTLRVAILTVSDRCSRGEQTDLSGPAIERVLTHTALKNTHVSIVAQQVVPDDVDSIQRAILAWTDMRDSADPADAFPHLVLTTGGTGFAPRDVTPEAVGALIQRPASGLVFAMMQASMAATPLGALARPVAGARYRTLMLTLPGSPKAIPEILTPILSILPHAVKLLQSKEDPHVMPSPQPSK